MDTFDKRFVRITGGTEDARAREEQKFWNIQAEKRKKYEQYAQEPTERQKEIIHIARQGVDQIIRGYGGDPSQSPEYRSFIVPHRAVDELDLDFRSAYISHYDQSIIVEWHNSDIGAAISFAHELFHARSPKSLHIKVDRDQLTFRSGATYASGTGDRKLSILEEALVGTLAREFYETIVRTNELFRDEVLATGTIKLWIERFCKYKKIDPAVSVLLTEELLYFPNAISFVKTLECDQPDNIKFAYVAGMIDRLRHENLFDTSQRYEERQKLNALMDDIVSHSSGELPDRHAVFAVLVKAAFTNDWSPSIRMIERTLGRPAVRRIVKDFSGRIHDHVAREQEKEENKEGI